MGLSFGSSSTVPRYSLATTHDVRTFSNELFALACYKFMRPGCQSVTWPVVEAMVEPKVGLRATLNV